LFVAAGAILWTTTKPGKQDVVDIVEKHQLRARAGLAFDARPRDGYYGGHLQLQF
jgi:hypothetical protein